MSSDYFERAITADATARLAALGQFGCLVADARTRPTCGQWDYKYEIARKWGNAQEIDFCTIKHDERVIFYYDIWANIHYGYVGKAAGFSENELLTGAALEQAVAHPGQTGDDPSDRASIQIGARLYREGSRVSEEGVLRELYIHKSELNKARVENGEIIEVYR